MCVGGVRVEKQRKTQGTDRHTALARGGGGWGGGSHAQRTGIHEEAALCQHGLEPAVGVDVVVLLEQLANLGNRCGFWNAILQFRTQRPKYQRQRKKKKKKTEMTIETRVKPCVCECVSVCV